MCGSNISTELSLADLSSPPATNRKLWRVPHPAPPRCVSMGATWWGIGELLCLAHKQRASVSKKPDNFPQTFVDSRGLLWTPVHLIGPFGMKLHDRPSRAKQYMNSKGWIFVDGDWWVVPSFGRDAWRGRTEAAEDLQVNSTRRDLLRRRPWESTGFFGSLRESTGVQGSPQESTRVHRSPGESTGDYGKWTGFLDTVQRAECYALAWHLMLLFISE